VQPPQPSLGAAGGAPAAATKAAPPGLALADLPRIEGKAAPAGKHHD